MYPSTLRVHLKKKRTAKHLSNDAFAMVFCCCCLFFSDFFYTRICCGHSFELHRKFDAIQMGTCNICLSIEADKKYTGCDLNTKKLLDCGLIGVCAVIRSNTVCQNGSFPMTWFILCC